MASVCDNCTEDICYHPYPSDPEKFIQCYYDVKNDTTQFIQCNFGEPVYHSCAHRLIWNPVLNVCDWPRHPTYCDQCPEGQECIYPSPDSQIQYFRCPGGIVNCDVGMVYDADKTTCFVPEHVV